MSISIADIRKNYSLKSLLENEVPAQPVALFARWWEEAVASNIDEVNAMTLATASCDGMPSARIVLLKNFNESGFSFFTNYHSYKGKQLEENPKACLVFYWKELERQVRITGLVEKLEEQANDLYFGSRPDASQAGAVISPQSEVIESREWLQEQFDNMTKQSAGKKIERPPHWGGYLVKPVIIEFWQGQPGRLHDRLQYTLIDDGSWKLERLAP
jgi:pyridoxamine 5'-phosphate oxidase